MEGGRTGYGERESEREGKMGKEGRGSEYITTGGRIVEGGRN